MIPYVCSGTPLNPAELMDVDTREYTLTYSCVYQTKCHGEYPSLAVTVGIDRDIIEVERIETEDSDLGKHLPLHLWEKVADAIAKDFDLYRLAEHHSDDYPELRRRLLGRDE